MKKHLSSQNASGGETERQTAPGGAEHRRAPGRTAVQCQAKTDPAPSASAPQPTDGSAGCEKTKAADATEVVNDVLNLDSVPKALVNKMLKEGSTFEDVVEGINALGGKRITLNAVKTYFQGNRVLQTQRARRQVEDAETLLSSLDKDPKSAEARLARATFLTGYSRVNRNASEVTPREAARYRMECENLNLKHQILTMQRKKAEQDLEYSRARTNLIKITQGKMQGDILRLERELRAHHAGDPIGPEVLQRIQQLYGLACQPLVYEETVNALAKA
jgi:hypothetical protein